VNVSPGEAFALVQEFPYFDNSIELDPLLASSLDLSLHNMITGFPLYVVGFEIYWCYLFFYL
jgi:hypothetical protein